MNITPRYAIAAFICFLVGITFFLWFNQYIIFNFSSRLAKDNQQLSAIKKKSSPGTVHFWAHNKWHKEKVSLLVSDDAADMTKQLISQLMDVLEQEKITEKHITLEGVVTIGANGHLLISFDRNPLQKNKNSFEKLMLIESMLKTLRENNIKITDVMICAHYKPLNDAELDFSNPWPIYGFLNG